jgi:hypothetical protein
MDSNGMWERICALIRIFRQDRHGIVEGVEFDLRHNMLDPSEWETNVLGLDPGMYQPGDPFLWFHWFGQFENGNGREPDAFLRQGDKIVVDDVDRYNTSHKLDRPHNGEIRVAYLTIVRSSGNREAISKPLTFMNKMSILNKTNTFEILSNSISEFMKSENAKDILANKYVYKAVSLHSSLEKRTRETREAARNIASNDEKHLHARETLEALNDAVRLGYFWAKAEAELDLLPHAEKALKQVELSAVGGVKSGEARRRKAASTWEPHARELAKEIRKQQPNLSQDNLATEIAFQWKDRDHHEPGHKTIKNLISKMEEDGDLPTQRKPKNRKRTPSSR